MKRPSARCVLFSLVIIALPSLPSLCGAAEFDCLLQPRQVVEIRSPVVGLIDRVMVERGQTVRAGQVLVSLDSGQERAALELARHRSTMEGAVKSGESRLEFASAKLLRRKSLVDEKFVSPQDVEESLAERRLAESELLDAKDNRRLAELEVRRNEEAIRLRTLVSPVNGVVVERNMNPGELADTADGRKPLLRIAEIGVLYAEAILPAEAYAAIKAGQKTSIRASVPVKLTAAGTVKVVDKVLDAASGTFGVRIEVPNPALDIPAGIHCLADFPQVPATVASRSPAPRPRTSLP